MPIGIPALLAVGAVGMSIIAVQHPSAPALHLPLRQRTYHQQEQQAVKYQALQVAAMHWKRLSVAQERGAGILSPPPNKALEPNPRGLEPLKNQNTDY